ncbi:hypothetical protein R3P38DRAFT_3095005, partial [Favolaschia claudopus]
MNRSVTRDRDGSTCGSIRKNRATNQISDQTVYKAANLPHDGSSFLSPPLLASFWFPFQRFSPLGCPQNQAFILAHAVSTLEKLAEGESRSSLPSPLPSPPPHPADRFTSPSMPPSSLHYPYAGSLVSYLVAIGYPPSPSPFLTAMCYVPESFPESSFDVVLLVSDCLERCPRVSSRDVAGYSSPPWRCLSFFCLGRRRHHNRSQVNTKRWSCKTTFDAHVPSQRSVTIIAP